MSASQRFSKLEREIRSRARAQLTQEVNTRFEPAIQCAANDADITEHLKQLRAGVIKSQRADAENRALEDFLAAKAPEPTLITLDALRNPVMVRIAANGERLPDTAKEYVAVLLPQFDLLYDVKSDVIASNWAEAVKLGSQIDIVGETGQLYDDVEAQLTIDRSRCNPAVHEAFAPYTKTDFIYWTRRPYASSPSDDAFFVLPHYGNVSWYYQGYRGRVRAVRRVRASQFGVLAGTVNNSN